MGIKIPNPKKEAEKAIKNIIKPAIEAGKREVYDGSKWARNKVREVQGEAEKSVKNVGREAQNEVRTVGKEIEDGLTEKLPDLIEDVAQELAEEASKKSIKEALDTAADVIEFMAPTRYTLIFGIELALVVQGEVTVSASFPNPVAKLTEIRKWAKNPPEGRAQIIECIKDFGPESLSAEFKISGNGGAVEWDGEDKYDRIDAFLEKHGVD